jgi:hypothetical protein
LRLGIFKPPVDGASIFDRGDVCGEFAANERNQRLDDFGEFCGSGSSMGGKVSARFGKWQSCHVFDLILALKSRMIH